MEAQFFNFDGQTVELDERNGRFCNFEDASKKNGLYVTSSILVSLRAGDYIGNVVGVPAGNRVSSPAL
jgi:hypothetical protein